MPAGTLAEKVVVIGAGIGGLSAALKLAHAGLDVTVVDRLSGPGGKMRQVPSVAGPIDAGPTVMTLRAVFDTLFDSVGTRLEDHVTLHPERILARHWWPDGSTLDLHSDPDESAEAMQEFGGDRAVADFQAFCARAKQMFEAFDAPMMRHANPSLLNLARTVARNPALVPAMMPGATLAFALDRQFTDKRLAQLFGRYATYVGGSPYGSPALLALVWHAEAQGVWRLEGGMHALARGIETVLRANGAKIHYETSAERIEMQGGRVAAVHLGTGQRLLADRVVFNGDPHALHLGLLGDAMRGGVEAKSVENRSLSAYVYSFAARPSGADLIHHNVFFGQNRAAEFKALRRGHMPDDPTLYICAQSRGSGQTATQGPEKFEIIMNGPPTTGAYAIEEEEATCRTRVFGTLERYGLEFDPVPARSCLMTPTDFGRMFPGSAGSLYGLSPHGMTASLAKPRVRSRIPGLYLAGGGVHPGAGVPMAGLSGQHAADAILSDLSSTSTYLATAMRGGMSTA